MKQPSIYVLPFFASFPNIIVSRFAVKNISLFYSAVQSVRNLFIALYITFRLLLLDKIHICILFIYDYDDDDGGDDDDNDDDGGGDDDLSLPTDWSLEAKNRSRWPHF